MPKAKKSRVHGPGAGGGAGNKQKKTRKMQAFAKLSTNNKNPSSASPTGKHVPSNSNHDSASSKSKKPPQQRRPIVPFGRKDRILLIGEGDFSFARSLVEQHRCKNVLATCYDSKETLYSKYPQAEVNVDGILSTLAGKGKKKNQEESPDGNEHTSEDEEERGQKDSEQHHRVLFSVDARKLGSNAGGGKEVRTGFSRREPKRPAWLEAKRTRDAGAASIKTPHGGPWDIICFNFPHVGGLSTDVNRQVRANQELLVAFFKACVPLLSPRPEVIEDGDEDWEFSDGSDSDSSEDSRGEGSLGPEFESKHARMMAQRRTEPGQILVSMFEGEPYTLWNIKDLARHAGLQVVTSFKFPWASYQGYSHARTIGEIEGKHGGRGGWRGEDRDARMYVFELKQDDRRVLARKSRPSRTVSGASKRARDASESDDSD